MFLILPVGAQEKLERELGSQIWSSFACGGMQDNSGWGQTHGLLPGWDIGICWGSQGGLQGRSVTQGRHMKVSSGEGGSMKLGCP